MHKTIRIKLFLTFLMTTFLVVSGMYIFMRWSLDRGFTEFVETRQQEHVTNLIEGLTEYYANNQSWSNLAGDKKKWIDILWQSNPHGHRRPPSWIKQAYTSENPLAGRFENRRTAETGRTRSYRQTRTRGAASHRRLRWSAARRRCV